MKKKEKNKDSRDEGKTCGNKTLEEFGRDEMEGQGPAHASQRRNPWLLTPEPPQERINCRACVLIVLNSEKSKIISTSRILENSRTQTALHSLGLT